MLQISHDQTSLITDFFKLKSTRKIIEVKSTKIFAVPDICQTLVIMQLGMFICERLQ